MPTKNPRLNITLEEDTMLALTALAKKRKQAVANVARELIFEAMERSEDMALSAIAELRESKKSKRVKYEDVCWD